MNANNSIIHTTHNESITTIKDEVSNFKLDTKVLFKGTKATIVVILTREDEFLEPVYKLLIDWEEQNSASIMIQLWIFSQSLQTNYLPQKQVVRIRMITVL